MIGLINTAKSSYDLEEATGVVIRVTRPCGRYMLFVNCISKDIKFTALIWGSNMTTGFLPGDTVNLFKLRKVNKHYIAQKGEVLQK